MRSPGVRRILPHWTNIALSLVAAGLLTVSFPDFDLWFLAWIGLVPLMWAVERENSLFRNFLLGWLFGTGYFFGTCWWLTYAPIHYAAIPWPIAYLLILIACALAGLFPGIFALVLSRLLRRFGTWAFILAPFAWVATEFARYWISGNDWNAIGYSQAFHFTFFGAASSAGVLSVSFFLSLISSAVVCVWSPFGRLSIMRMRAFCILLVAIAIAANLFLSRNYSPRLKRWIPDGANNIIAVQPVVPASGMDASKLRQLRDQQFSDAAIRLADVSRPATVVLPESPMDFMYNDDREFQQYVRDFTTRENVSLLFNSAEPDRTNGKYFNSAVMVGPDGRKAAEYDKIYLLPFGEAVPSPLDSIMPAFVGSFSYGRNYDLLPFGDAKAGIMICFESHFGSLGRHYVQNGADVIVEMTNDGYLGPTPVLRQHLANAIFRAVETNRPLIRVTNVGITAYITETGQVLDAAQPYQEATRSWAVSKSDGSQTLYVRFGDWFAWLCTILTFVFIGLTFRRVKPPSTISA